MVTLALLVVFVLAKLGSLLSLDFYWQSGLFHGAWDNCPPSEETRQSLLQRAAWGWKLGSVPSLPWAQGTAPWRCREGGQVPVMRSELPCPGTAEPMVCGLAEARWVKGSGSRGREKGGTTCTFGLKVLWKQPGCVWRANIPLEQRLWGGCRWYLSMFKYLHDSMRRPGTFSFILDPTIYIQVSDECKR